MNGKSGIIKTLGPGILFAGAAIGVSHLVQSTRAGANYGFALFWLVVLTNFLKYPFFEFSHRYTSATGESILTGYKQLGNWAMITFFILSFVTAFINISAIGLVTTGLVENLFQTGIPLAPLSVILLVVIVLILLLGQYPVLDKLMKFMIVILSITTLVALVTAIRHGSSVTPDFQHPDLLSSAGIAFMLALMGWMPAPIEVSVWPSLWALERKKETGYRPTLKESLTDFYIGYLGAAILALVFLSLGALVMYGTGEKFSNSGIVFASQLVQLYTQSLGSWSYIFISTAVLITMFSTLITVMDAYPRVLGGSLVLLFPSFSAKRKKIYWFWVLFLTAGSVLILLFFINGMKSLIDIATILAFLAAPLFAIMNYKTVTSKQISSAYRPPVWLRNIGIAGIVYLSGFGLFYIYTRLFW